MNVKDALNTQACRSLHITFDELREVVASNEKQRFSLKPVSEDADLDERDAASWLIRANQGHSIKIEDEGLLLTPITLDGPSAVPEMVVHGTNHSAWHAIASSGGLKPMGRNHVHFAAGLPEGFQTLKDEDEVGPADGAAEPAQLPASKADPVISGMRSSSTVLVYLDLPAALKEGIKFGRSENGVILTEGDGDGLVPIRFFARVEERKAGFGVLVRDGEVVKELPKHLASGAGGGRGRGRGRR